MQGSTHLVGCYKDWKTWTTRYTACSFLCISSQHGYWSMIKSHLKVIMWYTNWKALCELHLCRASCANRACKNSITGAEEGSTKANSWRSLLPGMVVHTCNPSTWQAEAERRLLWQVLRPHNKTLALGGKRVSQKYVYVCVHEGVKSTCECICVCPCVGPCEHVFVCVNEYVHMHLEARGQP